MTIDRLEAENAACYADAELKAGRFRELAEQIDAEAPGAVPEPVDENENSTVHHMEELRSKTRTPT